MPKTSNQKARLLYILQMLYEKTDENNYLTIKQITDELSNYEIYCERKAFYDDIEVLRSFGFDIISERYGRETGYFLASRNFEVAEVKMLVDIVQASKFVTKKKSDVLISKLGNLCSKNDREGLVKQLFYANDYKNINETIFYNVDLINSAILGDKGISFRYVDYFYNGKPEYRKDGKTYSVSPFKMVWDDENYYLVAYDEESGEPRHYRVDKMTDILVRRDERKGKDIFKKLDYSGYLKRIFGMYSGEEKVITFSISKALIKVFIDRFGSDIILVKESEDRVALNVKLDVSKQFFGWLVGLGKDVEIKAPNSVREEFASYLEEILKKY